MKLDSAGDVVWIFGTPSGWNAPYDALLLEPVGEVSWPFHQHGPHVVGDRITLFDNREEQRTPYDEEPAPPPWSRVVVYEVNEGARSVTQVREHAVTAAGTLHSSQIGDADPLPLTDGVLATYGYVLEEDGTTNVERGWGEVTTHLVEFAADGEVVSHVRFRSDGEAPMELGIRAYRAERLPSAYPTSGPAAAGWLLP